MLGELLDRSPRHVGPYRLLARLGAGAMGEVHLGADTRPGPAGDGPRLVAVKTVRAELVGDRELRDRFRREVATVRAVDSRFTARLLDADVDAAEPWLAAEYVAGPTLGRAVRVAGPLPAEAVRGLGLGLVRALRGIHHARVLHRDLKPANVLLGADGPRVIDFGIARGFGASTMTATGVMVGSPGFMSPEHVRGGRSVVAASDVFCLASVLAYAATGRSPFGDGPVAAVLYRILRAEADLADVPDGLRALIEDCLSADPSTRPDTAALEARFRTAATDEADAAPWPPEVRELVAEDEAELARVVAAAGPLAPPVPTMPGASPVHSAETVTAPPRAAAETGDQPAGPRRRSGRRTAALVVAAALVVGAVGGLAANALRESGGERTPAASGSPSQPSRSSPSPSAPPRAETGAGVDRHGVDRSRYFPVDGGSRPEGWRPWSAKLDGRPRGCAMNRVLLVCRTFDGGLEAVSSTDGRPLWKAPSPAPGERPAMTGARGVVIPGRGSNPLLHGDTVVSAEGGMVRGRSTEDGTVRWEHESGAGREAENVRDAILGDGVAFFSLQAGEGGALYAFDAATGKRLWRQDLSARHLPTAAFGMHGAEAFVEGRVVAGTSGGLTGFDARSGKPAPLAVPGGGDGTAVRAHGGHILCDVEGGDTVTLDAVTLRPVPPGDPADEPLKVPAENVIPAGSRQYRLEHTGRGVELTDLGPASARTPRVVGVPPRELEDAGEGEGGSGYSASDPVIVGSTALFLDNRYLYTLPLRNGERARHEIKGAPGNRGTSGLGSGGFDDAQSQVWAPELLSLGGALFLVFHDGTVRSLELPG
ncbi:PQQ-binding-like beta-propeller repeat protein [Streptomyces sp. OF3]|uniref:PQQ-binding-like beta-propeller repeat protein n=1 Tax=Streptomyces alkaliterrae TaxID=2213162 RepID=A0A7W3ZQ33_9ACTN|nr:serine/threonine-protein kinase [Streptomyces alkaliterrae]MBB1256152.1 PQQ-binding-like beta-propeller repeat protein [Streptomyces alkaliterrae]